MEGSGGNPFRQSDCQTLLVRVWYEEACEPHVIRDNCADYPFFAIAHSQVFFQNVLHGDLTTAVSTFNPESHEWEIHDPLTIRRLLPGESVLLYRLFSNGNVSLQLEDCPGLEDSIRQLLFVVDTPTLDIFPPPAPAAKTRHSTSPYHQQIGPTTDISLISASSELDKEWPTEYLVCEIHAYFKSIHGGSLTSNLNKKPPGLSSFQSAFRHSRYVRVTVEKHWKAYRELSCDPIGTWILNENPDILWVDLMSHVNKTRRPQRASLRVPSLDDPIVADNPKSCFLEVCSAVWAETGPAISSLTVPLLEPADHPLELSPGVHKLYRSSVAGQTAILPPSFTPPHITSCDPVLSLNPSTPVSSKPENLEYGCDLPVFLSGAESNWESDWDLLDSIFGKLPSVSLPQQLIS
ncbi:hypothetical protein AAF712_010223 [Marasmius tenuissimus]|uniref:Uncharacterized protein n=1 Tax=Marasmius tenuissimus TaxID=585030 RepID=A0ABR2ZP24_9AGAR